MSKITPSSRAEARALVLRDVVGADVAHAGDRLAEPLRQPPHLAHPQLAERVDLALQLGDHVHLDRIEADRGQAHDRVLHEHEGQNREQRAALERRQREGIAHEAADRLDLGGDHRDDLARGDAAEMGQREAQDARVEVVAQPPQHALGDDPLIDVDDVFEAAVDQHEAQEDAAQQEQVVDLREALAEQVRTESPASASLMILFGSSSVA